MALREHLRPISKAYKEKEKGANQETASVPSLYFTGCSNIALKHIRPSPSTSSSSPPTPSILAPIHLFHSFPANSAWKYQVTPRKLCSIPPKTLLLPPFPPSLESNTDAK